MKKLNNFQDLKELIGYSEKGIVSKVIFKNDKLDVSLFCMAKGTALSEHTSTREAIVHVLEGKGVFGLGKENIAMLPGVIIHMKPNAKHALKANENTSFVLTLIN
jgi:nitric oxide dioxygenase